MKLRTIIATHLTAVALSGVMLAGAPASITPLRATAVRWVAMMVRSFMVFSFYWVFGVGVPETSGTPRQEDKDWALARMKSI